MKIDIICSLSGFVAGIVFTRLYFARAIAAGAAELAQLELKFGFKKPPQS
jgi:hypothetical protein